MQTWQSGSSTPATQTSRTSIKLEEQGNGDVLVSVWQTQNQAEPSPRPQKTPTPQENWGMTIGLAEMTPNKPAIPLTFGLGKRRTKAKHTRWTPRDGVLQQQLVGIRQRETGMRMVPQEMQGYAIRLDPAIRNKGTSTGGPNAPSIKNPSTKDEACHQELEGMLQRQVLSTCPIQGGRTVLPSEGRNEEGPLAL